MPIVCYFDCVIFRICWFDHDEWLYIPRFTRIFTKHELVEWLCIDL